jgi:hypothetical protein
MATLRNNFKIVKGEKNSDLILARKLSNKKNKVDEKDSDSEEDSDKENQME